MEFEIFNDSTSTPKLSLFSLPTKPPKPPDPPGILTPPLHKTASVPFHWEEAPGKPRHANNNTTNVKTKTHRCLDLPPRLLVTNMPSPTTVLNGPYSGRCLSQRMSFRSPEDGRDKGRRESRERFGFTSGRWDSFREVSSRGGSYDFLSSTPVVMVGSEKRVKRKKSRFLSFPSTDSNLLGNIYESFKQALPWRRKQENLRKMGS